MQGWHYTVELNRSLKCFKQRRRKNAHPKIAVPLERKFNEIESYIMFLTNEEQKAIYVIKKTVKLLF
jgi:hypothetical protein